MANDQAPEAHSPAGLAAEQGNAPANAPARALAESLLQKGLDHYDREEFEQAFACYGQAVEADPTFELAYNNQGMVLIDLGQYEQALEALILAVRLAPQYAEAYNNLGFALRRLNRNAEAASAYAIYLQLDPDVEEGPRIQQWVQQVMQEQQLAELPPLAFLESPAPVPTEAEAPGTPPGPAVSVPGTDVAKELTDTGEFDELPGSEAEMPPAAVSAPADPPKIKKMAAWEAPDAAAPAAARPASVSTPADPPKIKKMAAWEAVAAMPKTAATVSPFGDVGAVPASPSGALATPQTRSAAASPAPLAPAPPLATAGRAGSAEAADAQSVLELVERGMDLFAEDRLDEAYAAFEQAVQAEPGSAEAHTGMGKVLIRQERSEKGIEELRTAIAADPSDPSSYYVLGFALRAAGRNAEAADAYDRFLEFLPEALDAQKIRQWIQHVRSSPGGGAAQSSAVGPAVVAPEPATPQAAPDTNLPPEDLAFPAEEQEIVTEADKSYQKALKLFQEGNMDEAMRGSVKALNDDPGHLRSRVLLGRIHLRQKLFPQAIEQLEGALVTSPEFPEALYFLGQAYEKSGNHEKASEAYQRCLKVAPQGPRAERLREWLTTQTLNLGKATTTQVQCELCLRLFPQQELKDYDGKKTCPGCLALIGGAPAADRDPLAARPPDPSASDLAPLPVEQLRVSRRSARGLVLTGLCLLLALAAAGAAAWKFTKLPERWGLRVPPAPPPPVAPVSPVPPPEPAGAFDKTKVTLEGKPLLQVMPWARWTYAPSLKGLEGAPKDLQVVYALKTGPEGMTVDAQSGALNWAPQGKKTEALLAGVSVPVQLEVQGSVGKEKEEQAVFGPVSQSFVLNYQFGFSLGNEIDLGLAERDRFALATGDFNGDGRPDVALAKGHLAQGSLRFYFQTVDNPFPSPLRVEDVYKIRFGQLSAMQAVDFDGDGLIDLLTADRYSGKIQCYLQNKQHVPQPGPAFLAGQGPVALAAADADGDKRLDLAVLLGLEHKLVLCQSEGGERFSPPKSVDLPMGGPQGWVCPWKSAERGPGFLAVLPLARTPLCFVPWKSGEIQAPVFSGWEAGKLVLGAARVRSAYPAAAGLPAPRRMVLLSAGESSELQVLDEREGQFQASLAEKVLPAGEPALALVSADWNMDGLDDLAVIHEQGVRLFFRQESGFVEGPAFMDLGRLEGPAAALDLNGDGRPDLLLLTGQKKVRLLLSKTAQAVAVEAEAVHVPAPKAPSPSKTSAPETPPAPKAPSPSKTSAQEAPEAPKAPSAPNLGPQGAPEMPKKTP